MVESGSHQNCYEPVPLKGGPGALESAGLGDHWEDLKCPWAEGGGQWPCEWIGLASLQPGASAPCFCCYLTAGRGTSA